MKEYRIIELGVSKKNTAETVMNDMAKKGWRVVSTTYWSGWSISLLITFERDV